MRDRSQAERAVRRPALRRSGAQPTSYADEGLSALRIDVDTKEGVVTLSGVVDSSTLKDRATQTAQQVGGVRAVVDNLAVKATG